MSVRRVMGTETEYAVSQQGTDRYNPVRLSFDVVAAAADKRSSHIRWDYRGEDPVNDARGHRLDRAAARPDMLTDVPQRDIVNVIAPNGGRVYVDHAHPEYSSPETTDPFDAVRYDHAGDQIMLTAVQHANRTTGRRIVLHRNNVDGKGASWGTHENYMMLRSVPFDHVVALLTPHLVSRQIYTGSGRVGLGEHGETPGYQLSQRADYIHMRVGLQTTFDRPIINTRDESHTDGDHRRLHVIVGDANRMDVPQLLKLGTTSMVLWLLEHGDEAGIDINDLCESIALADPVTALHTVSHDLTLAAPLKLEDGKTTDAWNIQVRLRATVYEAAAAIYGVDSHGEPVWPDESTQRVMTMWGKALLDVATVRHADDDARLNMHEQASRLEWLLKWQLLERQRRKSRPATTTIANTATGIVTNTVVDASPNANSNADADTDITPTPNTSTNVNARSGMNDDVFGWDDARLKAIDLSWAALDPATSVFSRLDNSVEQLNDDAALANAAAHAPEETRAWLRAEVVSRYPEQMMAASWSQLTARDASADGGMRTIDITNPLAFGKKDCQEVVDHTSDVVELFSALQNHIAGNR